MIKTNSAILIVDDEPAITNLLSTSLEQLSYRCIIANNGESAIESLVTDNIEVMLLDIKLPDISGIEVLEKAMEINPGIVTIIITAVNDDDVEDETLSIGAFDYITKPFDVVDITKKVAQALKGTSEFRDVNSNRDTIHDIPNFGKVEMRQYMDTLASSIEKKLDELVGFSRVVEEETIRLARSMKISEGCIQEWADMRSAHKKDTLLKIKKHLTDTS